MICEQYVELGISVIPIQPGTKEPHIQRLKAVGWRDEDGGAIWHPATKEIATPEVLTRWFGDGQASIALVAGEVSNNLVYLDWDSALSYRKWALNHKEIVNCTAVSKTAAGYHVFFRTPKPIGGSHLYYGNAHAGHIRGTGMYVVAPPSVHPSGIEYTWLRHPSGGVAEIESLAEIDIRAPKPDELPRGDYVTEPVSVTDEVILIRAASAGWCRDTFVPLWMGDWAKPRSDYDPGRRRYPSQSEGDLALCRILAYWTGRDASRIDRMFRRSGLYRREKWNEAHFATGETYGQHTIMLACQSTNKVFKVQRKYMDKWRKI